jgi:hypothetical protein
LKRFLLLGVVAVAMLAFPGVASAANAHFIDNQPDAGDPQCLYPGSGNTITCSFKIAGLGNVSQVTANLEVTRTCSNNGNPDIPGQRRSRPQTLDVDNGQTTQSPVPFTFQRLQCPGNQETDLGDTVEFFINGVSIGTVPLRT